MRQTIVHVTEALGGGVLYCLALLANRQVNAGDEVVIIHSVRKDTPCEAELSRIFDSRVRRCVVSMKTELGFHDIMSMIMLFREIRKMRPDILHLHSSKAAALGRIVGKMNGMTNKIIYSPHGLSFLKKDISRTKAMLYLGIERFLHNLGGNIVTCSRSERQYASRLLGHTERIGMVENAVDLTAFDNLVSKDVDGSTTICTSGRVSYQKAPWRFSKLAQRMHSDNIDNAVGRFIWFGDGDANLVRKWIDRTVVELTGWVSGSELRQRLAECDLFVLPSLWEGMPIALIEAQALGLPAIASRVVGNRDVIRHGVTGFLANSDDELAAYAQRLVRDPGLRHQMGMAARKSAFERFGSERLFRSYVQIYRSLISSNTRKFSSLVFRQANRVVR